MPGERRRAGRWRWLKLNGGQMTGVSAPVATRRRKGRSSRKELRRTVVQGETDADGLHCGGRREPGWTLLLYTGYDNEACPLSWAGPSVPCGETTDWRAGCGKSASPVRREGAAKAAPYPYRKSMRRSMGGTNAVAHDPSVADYRATSPASPGRNSMNRCEG